MLYPYKGQGSLFLYLQLGSPSFIENLQLALKLHISFSYYYYFLNETQKCWVTLRLSSCQSMNLTYKVKCLWILVYFSPLSFKASLSNVNENLCLFHYRLSLFFLKGLFKPLTFHIMKFIEKYLGMVRIDFISLMIHLSPSYCSFSPS